MGIDDSGSMIDEENGNRISALRTFLQRIVSITAHFDPAGISVRFLNHEEMFDGVRDESMVADILKNVQFKGWTRLGTEMWKKVAMPLVVTPARENRLQKPVLVMIVTDGKVRAFNGKTCWEYDNRRSCSNKAFGGKQISPER